MGHIAVAVSVYLADHVDHLLVLGIQVVPAGDDIGPVIGGKLGGGGSSRLEVAMQVLDRLGTAHIGPLLYPRQIFRLLTCYRTVSAARMDGLYPQYRVATTQRPCGKADNFHESSSARCSPPACPTAIPEIHAN